MSFVCVPARQTTPKERKGSIVLAANSSASASAFGGVQPVSASAAAGASSAAAAAAAANPAAAVAARGRSQQLRPIESENSASAGFNMMISGAKTGEEKVFSATDVRRPQDENSNADAQARRVNRSNSSVTTDADRIRKLEQELRRSQEQVRKRTAEMESLKGAHKQSIADLNARHEKERLEALEAQKQQNDAAAKALIVQVDSLNGQVAKLNAELKKRTAEENEVIRRREGEFNASATMWSSEREMLQKEVEKLRKQVQFEKDTCSTLAAENKTAKASAESARADWAKLEQQLRTELAAALKEIRELKAKIEEQRENVEEWERRVDACNAFILQICQPKFSVVKDDDKLTPMSQAEAAAAAGTGGASGFVLVPLILMLDAYELLPKDAKSTIATKYEQDKKKRAL